MDLDIYKQVVQGFPKKIGIFSEMEKLIHNNLKIQDRDMKRYAIFHKIYKNSASVNEPNFVKIVDMLNSTESKS